MLCASGAARRDGNRGGGIADGSGDGNRAADGGSRSPGRDPDRARLSAMPARVASAARYRFVLLDGNSRLGWPAVARSSLFGARLWMARRRNSGPQPVAAPSLPGIDRAVSDFLSNLV